MTKEEIITYIISNRLEDEVYEALHRYREHKFKNMEHKLAESESTLKLIGKITKDKTVKDILSD